MDEPVLAVDDIQGNSIAGFNKDLQTHLYLRIEDVAGTKTWLAGMASHLASAREVQEFNQLYRRIRLRRQARPKGFVATWVNLALTCEGLRKLRGDEVDEFLDDAFRIGLAARSELLGDPADPDSSGHPDHWLFGGTKTPVDILVIIASDARKQLHAEISAVEHSLLKVQGALKIVCRQDGAVLPGALIGHEHFGFKDGISQPTVRGRKSEDPHDFFTSRLVDPNDPEQKKPNRRELSAPGDVLLWPGQFVFGYPLQKNDHPRDPGGMMELKPAWIANGSFVVVRRLQQNVAAFRELLKTEAERLAALPGFADMTADRLGALLVGRWKSGAPLIRAPLADDPKLAHEGFANNHFVYQTDTKPVLMTNGFVDPFPQGTADPDGLRCPHGAHIRKVNPRDDGSEQGGPNDTLTRRILRRGIPFGPVLSEDPDEPDPVNGDRGLMFVSYQTDIARTFEFLTTDWVNTMDKPQGGAGHDPIISSPPEARTIVLHGSNDEIERLEIPVHWILPTGGGYFFAPSISVVRDVLAV